MIAAVLKKSIAADYPHLKLPTVVYARVSSASKLSKTYEYGDITVEHDATCGTFHGKVTLPWYRYNLTVIDRFGNDDSSFPALPGIESKKQFQIGAIVAIALPYGDLTPAIIGEVVL
jgi:hypothetical protein